MFTQDSRNKSENDECRGRLLNTICKFFKSPSPPDKSATSPSKGEVNGLLRFTRNDDRVRAEVGRSMIEMLGVLAIIGVLSVGGIAGYSKAMEKFKYNKITQEYTDLIFGLLPFINTLPDQNGENNVVNEGITELADSLNLIPKTWRITSSKVVMDEYGNNLNLFIRNGQLVLDVYLSVSGESQQFYKFCQEFTTNFIQPLHSVLYRLRMYKASGVGTVRVYYGSDYCTADNKCIKDLTVAETDDYCRSCGESGKCALAFEFPK